MQTPDLFADAPYMGPPSRWEVRDVNGWHQSREVVGKRAGPWRFYVTGFKDETCHVLRSDKTMREVPINSRNWIMIDGRWYSRKHWAH